MARVAFVFSAFVVLVAMSSAIALEPLAPLASQPVWQAAEPVSVNVEYDGKRAFPAISENARDLAFCVRVVPVFGAMDELRELKKASAVEDAQRSLLRPFRFSLSVLPWVL